jgi:hypothetical protein
VPGKADVIMPSDILTINGSEENSSTLYVAESKRTIGPGGNDLSLILTYKCK